MGVVMAAIIGACMVASPASQNSKATKKPPKGKGENIGTPVEAEGQSRMQGFPEKRSAAVAWTIESEGKASAKDPALCPILKNGANATAESSELKETKRTQQLRTRTEASKIGKQVLESSTAPA